MLSDFDIHACLDRQSALTERGRDLILKTCQAPSRMVGTHARKNIISFPYSEKVGVTLSTESRTAEGGFFKLCEYDPDVILFLDQVEPVTIQTTDRNGKRCTTSYTADFLVFRQSSLEVVEVKTADEVEELIKTKSDSWVRLEDGTVEFLPAKRAFKEMGIPFRVFVYDSAMRFFVSNITVLLWSRGYDVDCHLKESDIAAAFDQSYCLTLADLKDHLELKDSTPLIQLVDKGQLFIDMKRSLLSQPRGCVVARSIIFLEMGSSSVYDSHLFHDDLGSVLATSIFPSEKEASRALEKIQRLESGVSDRSTRRWIKKIREGDKLGLTPFQSLISDYKNCGNRRRRLFVDVEKFLLGYLENQHPSFLGISIYRSYIRYRCDAKVAHPLHEPVSRKTFYERILKSDPQHFALTRGGVRAANAVAPPTDPEKRSITAQCAWEVAMVDHYLADIELVFFSNQAQIFVIRPWITAMVDAFSKEVIAVSISFKSPSRTSCAKVMRDCVRRHGKLPRELIVDRGSEFKSVFFASLIANYKMTLTFRPAGNPRYGSEVERLFGEFRTVWLSQLPGNRADKREVRSADGKTSPKNSATFQPYEFYKALLSFCESRGARCRGVSAESTAVAFENSQGEMPFIPIKVAYDASFLLATSVDSKSYKVDFQRGLHISGVWYWSPKISLVRGRLSSLEVRVDPENPHVVYALLVDVWEPCYSSGFNSFSAKDHVSQLVEGVRIREGQSYRDLIRTNADEHLVSRINEMKSAAKTALAETVHNSVAVNDVKDASIFDKVKSAKVSSLKIEGWV